MKRRRNRKKRKDAGILNFFSWSEYKPWKPMKESWRCCGGCYGVLVISLLYSQKQLAGFQDWSALVLDNWSPLKGHLFPRTLSLYEQLRAGGQSTRNAFSFHFPRSVCGHYSEYEQEATFFLQPCLGSLCFSGDPSYAINCFLSVFMPCFCIGVLVWKPS